jgi:type IV pilus assembly protein PilV
MYERRRGVSTMNHTRGTFLLEALVAIVIFSLALLGLAAAIAGALRQAGAAQWRGEAVDAGASTLARMSVEDPATLAARYDAVAEGDGYRTLLARALRLPGVSPSSNRPDVAIVDDADQRRILVTLFWQLPGDARIHHARVGTVLPAP